VFIPPEASIDSLISKKIPHLPLKQILCCLFQKAGKVADNFMLYKGIIVTKSTKLNLENRLLINSSVVALALGIYASSATAQTNGNAAEVAPNVAQTEKSIQLEEIVVTAQKRSENLQETPIAISAFTGDGIARKGLSDVQQVAQLAPNVTFDFTSPISGASNAAAVYIRGIGQSDFALTTEAGVGTYVDGVYMSRSLGGVLDVLDIERIEILRGPQGTLFGRNTIGGAISIISKLPGDELGGSIEATFGDSGRRYLRGSVNVPLGPDTGMRLSVSSKDRNGFVKTALTQDQERLLGQRGLTDLGNENRQAVRLVLAHKFSDVFSATLSGDIGRVRENNAPSRLVGITGTLADGPLVFVHNVFTAPATTLPGFPNANYSAANFITNNDTTYATGPNGTKLNSWGAALTLEFKPSDTITLKSITAFRKTTGEFNRDADGSPLVITHTSNYGYKHEQFSQEFQLVGTLLDSRLKYATGLYFFHETGSDPLLVELPPAFGTIFQKVADISNNSYAGFAQATFEVVENVSVTAGGRYTIDKKKFVSDQYLFTGPVAPIVLGAPAGIEIPLVPRNSIAREKFTNFSPRVSIDYKLDNVLLYGSFSQGFKSGGFNLRYVAPRPNVLAFDPEKASTFEAGLKLDGFDRRVRLNAALFHTSYKDIQVTVFESLGAPVTLNAGDAKLKGFEVEFTALPVEGLELNANIGYINAKYTTIRANPALVSTPEQIISTATRLPNVPKWQGTMSASYAYELENEAKLDIRGDLRFSSSAANDAQNSRYLEQTSYQTLNLSGGYTAPDRKWNLRVFVENLTDKRYIVSGDSNFGIGFHEANFNRPREWGITLGVNF
jgi:iron complex outermembrane recepter protein